jgi:HlyD family secretion protein
VASKRGDFAGLANPALTQPERQELVRTIRNALYDEIALLLDDKQKEGLLDIKARLDERRAQNAGSTSQRLYIINAKGESEGKNLRLGLSDGTYTEVLTPSAKEGDKFITGASAAK